MYSYQDIFSDKKKALFVMAHPDDVDVFFGGTICKLREENKEVFVVVMTNGCRGSRENNISEEELARERFNEQKQALSCYEVPESHFSTLNYKDGEAENNMELIGKIAYHIRKFKPDIVCTHNPNGFFSKSFTEDYYHVNHKDHRVCGLSAMDAVYPFSRDRSFFPEHANDNLEPHTVKALLFTGTQNETNTEIDISEFIEKKENGLREHKSQFDNETIERIMRNSQGIERGFYITLR